jgi:filamentous hemagglutinin family protein
MDNRFNCSYELDQGNNGKNLCLGSSMICPLRQSAMAGFVLFFGILSASVPIAQAQVLPDGTLPTLVTRPNNLDFAIEGGSRSGSNLFHSFSQFSVPTGGAAVFDNPTDIQNIFSRVTGGRTSNIDGLIRANGSANLFLLNPSGIIFGPNARLDIGGSFLGTTASHIQFADGIEFSAANPTPLLTVTAPIGLQFGPTPGGIAVQGPGHQLFATTPFAPLDPSNNPVGLQVGVDRSLVLIGGAVDLSGGIIATQGGGHLEIGSVQEGSRVNLNPSGRGWVGDYSAVQQFNDIHLAQQALLDATGRSSSVLLQGKNISLTEGSVIFMQNFGVERSGDLTVKATGTLNLIGNSQNGRLGSLIQLNNLGAGATGDVNIAAAEINLSEGGSIGNRTYSPAPGGNVSINVAGSVLIDGVAPANPVAASSISTGTYNSNDAGNATITAGRLSILNGGSFSSLTAGSGKAGTVRVNARDLVEVAGNNALTLTPSTLVSTSFGSGNATDVLINTARLVVQEGGIIGSSAYVTAAAGDVIINASESLDLGGRANGSITASRIASTAEILDPATQAAYGLPPIPQGDAGSLRINTPSLRITDGAYVTVKNDGPGSAGDLEINGRSIFLNNQGAITASTASGNGGDIRLNLQDSLVIRNSSGISATAAGKGSGGNLTIEAPIVLGLENSDITASAFQGQGGKITLTTQGIFGLKYRDRLTPKNDITASSEFGVSGTVQVNTIGVNPGTGLVALPVDPIDPSQKIATGCGSTQDSSFIATGRGGTANNPSQIVTLDRTWSDLRAMDGAKVRSVAMEQTAIEATALATNAQGQIELIGAGSTAAQIVATCAR